MNERMKTKTDDRVLSVEYFFGENIDREGEPPQYVKVKYRRVEQYKFFLRFLGKEFIPCVDDQSKLKELLLNVELHISTQRATIHFLQKIKNNKIAYAFGLPFLNSVILYEFSPCTECQKEIRELLQTAESLIIGNDKYEHPVELNRRIMDDDKTFFTVEKHPATQEELKSVGNFWLYENITKETYDKTLIIPEVS